MINFIKWFWVSINFKKWTFEGRKLANPLLIIFRLILIIPIIIVSLILWALLTLSGNKHTADDMLNSCWSF